MKLLNVLKILNQDGINNVSVNVCECEYEIYSYEGNGSKWEEKKYIYIKNPGRKKPIDKGKILL